MYICLECGCVFDGDEIVYWTEHHGLDYGPYEKLSGCPNCSGAYIEAHRCDSCGEWIDTETYVKIGDKRYCENCYTICNLEEE